CPEHDQTSGARQITSAQFYLRLVQRVIHLFTTRTNSGLLYEIDTRLRPSGKAGLLVCSLQAFATYQQQEAWTWVHQALVRARAVYGTPALWQQFDTIDHQVLYQRRDKQLLQQQVCEMRHKMRTHLSTPCSSQFDLKIDAGSIGDIEFMTQYLVLLYAHQQPLLTKWSDNVRILQSLAEFSIISQQQARQLIAAYTT